jgi:hypothetical protein
MRAFGMANFLLEGTMLHNKGEGVFCSSCCRGDLEDEDLIP